MSQEALTIEEAFKQLISSVNREFEYVEDRFDALERVTTKQNQEIELLKRRASDQDVRFDGHHITLDALNHRCDAFNKRIENLEPFFLGMSEVRPDTDFTKDEEILKRDYGLGKDVTAPAPQTIYQGARNEGKNLALAMSEISTIVFGSPCNMPSPDVVVHHVKGMKDEYQKLKQEVEQLSKDRYTAQKDADKYKSHLHTLCAAVFGREYQHYDYPRTAEVAARHREAAAQKDKLIQQLHSMGLASSQEKTP